MASFVNANLGSDSESDDSDFDPTKEAGHEGVSEEEVSGDDENPNNAGKKSKKKVKKSDSKRSGGCFQEETAKDEESEKMKLEFQKEQEEIKEQNEKKKNDDIWSDFLKDVGGSSGQKKPLKSGGGLGSLTSMSNKKGSKKPASNSKAKSTTVKKPASSIASIFDTFSTDTLEDKKPEKIQEQPKSLMSSIFESVKQTTEAKKETEAQEKADENKLKITKVFDFAGETVEVTKEVEKDSKEAKQFLKKQENEAKVAKSATKRPGGLNSIMGVISDKAPKMGTLDKSKMDWNDYVKKEGIKEELESHNRGKDGYVEKQMFLERADYRRFEIEREAREKSRKTLTK